MNLDLKSKYSKFENIKKLKDFFKKDFEWLCICSDDHQKKEENCCIHKFWRDFSHLMNYSWLSDQEKAAFYLKVFERLQYTYIESNYYMCS